MIYKNIEDIYCSDYDKLTPIIFKPHYNTDCVLIDVYNCKNV